jgi:hypothetical protein
LDNKPDWLTTAYFLERLGGIESFDSFVADVYTGAIQKPENIDPDTGWIRESPDAKKATLISGRTRSTGRASFDVT